MDATKNPNLETTHTITIPSTSSQTFKRAHEELLENYPSFLAAGEGEGRTTMPPPEAVVVVVESGREKLKRHRMEMSGRVWIPEIWGQEDLLKKWIDCTVFDSGLEKSSIMSAREALIQEGRSTLSIENSC
ncbi:hypothetical protein L1987_29532 [Smallanthus sonchifolius]|uniref:Uncharacterized protein n=1 Tax=Smallanthus sonchifolius TaxID=185202 RepID=A0ACB9I059_9ASTR|nr:hypothetical protein L1987_29532 [Smallanthus sonchifolius]